MLGDRIELQALAAIAAELGQRAGNVSDKDFLGAGVQWPELLAAGGLHPVAFARASRSVGPCEHVVH
jgi:hypothetical protein